jgi:Rhodopirellula transposase DDE domain
MDDSGLTDMVTLMGSHQVMACTKDEYLATIEMHHVRILEIFWLHKKKIPIMLLDVMEETIFVYPYMKFKKALSVAGQESLTKQYNEALRGCQFVLFIRDSQRNKLISYSVGRPSGEQSCGGRQRIRRFGGGRKFIEVKDPTIVPALEEMVKDEVAGDPMTEQKWVRSSLSGLSKRLAIEGHHASPGTVARLLKQMGFSLRANKRKQGRFGCADRDEQFKYIATQKQEFVAASLPIISVDTKKKELIGDFRNKGRAWCRQAEEVNEHDFPGAAKCRAVPFGIYDPTRNQGYVYVGVSNNTPQFSVHSVARW